jgi:glyoxylase-like metal-dependent hydrolase (beta-lactamase superfamily II)
MRIGPYTLHEVGAGQLRLDGGAMFGIIPRPLWERRIPPDERGRIPLAMRCLLAEGDGRVILIDNGLGDKYDARFADIYGIEHEPDELHRSLARAGFSPADVSDVVLTHLHFDHCGGSTTRGDDGRLTLAFPKATYHLQRRHWEWAQVSPREQASFLTENILPLEESGQLRLHEGGAELYPGLELIVVDGHTRGQQLVRFHDPSRSLLFAGDLLPTAAHVPLLWIMAYDVAPLDTLAEKQRILSRAAEKDWIIFFEHDVDTATAHIEVTERGFSAVDKEPTLARAFQF